MGSVTLRHTLLQCMNLLNINISSVLEAQYILYSLKTALISLCLLTVCLKLSAVSLMVFILSEVHFKQSSVSLKGVVVLNPFYYVLKA